MEYGGCLEAAGKREHATAYRGLSAAFLVLVSIIHSEDGWLLPLLRQATYDMRVLAELGDHHVTGGQALQRDCGEKLMKGFAVCMNDRTDIAQPLSRRRGVVFMVVSCFR